MNRYRVSIDTGRSILYRVKVSIPQWYRFIPSAVLPLLPPSEVINGWSYITRKQTEDENIKEEDLIQTWNVFGSQHRTTNCLEGWHNKLNREVGKKKPNILHFLNIIQKDASLVTVRHTMVKKLNMYSRTNSYKICKWNFCMGICLLDIFWKHLDIKFMSIV